MKRVFVLIVLVLFAVALAFAGGSEEAGAAEKTSLQIMVQWNPDQSDSHIVRNTIEAWEAANPNVALEMDAISHEELEQKSATLAAADSLPDMLAINGKDITAWGQNAGMLLDLVPYLDADPEWRDLQIGGAFDDWTRGDSIYAVPSEAMVTHLIYYRTDILEDLGYTAENPIWGGNFPSTWDGFISLLEDLKGVVDTPWAMGDSGKWLFVDPVFGTLSNRFTGTEWHTRALQHEAAFTDPEFVAALEMTNDLVQMGAFNSDAPTISNEEMRALYFNEKAAMFVEGSWAVPVIYRLAPPEIAENTRIAILPAVPGRPGKATDAVMLTGWGYALSSRLEDDPAKLEAGISLLRALSDETYGAARAAAGLLPAQKIMEFDDSEVDPLAKLFTTEILPNITGIPHLMIPFGADPEDALATGLQDMFVGIATPEEVAARVQAVWDQYR